MVLLVSVPWALVCASLVYALIRAQDGARSERAELLDRVQAPERVIETRLVPQGDDPPAIPFENDAAYFEHVGGNG